VEAGDTPGIAQWQSIDHEGNIWFEGQFSLPDFALLYCSDEKVGLALEQVLLALPGLKPRAISGPQHGAISGPQHGEFDNCPGLQPGAHIEARLDFPRNWGLGSSSTLIAAVARWFGVDPFQLLADTFGGSGYDVACAYAPSPILYQVHGEQATITPTRFDPPFKDHLFFVHLGQKQDSRAGIRYYREQLTDAAALVRDLSEITEHVLDCSELSVFESLLLEHEYRLAEAINLERAQTLYFADYPGVIKSLGAWGGDFVLATSPWPEPETREWFVLHGFDTVLGWDELFF